MSIKINGITVAGIGTNGKDATINGHNVLNILEGDNILITDDGSGNLTISSISSSNGVIIVRW